jgi:hypothetical protein
MAEELSKLWETFSLLEIEEGEVDVRVSDCQEIFTRGHACVIGKLADDRYVCKETIKKNLQQWWRPMGSLTLKVLLENLFLIEFERERDKRKHYRAVRGFLRASFSWWNMLMAIQRQRVTLSIGLLSGSGCLTCRWDAREARLVASWDRRWGLLKRLTPKETG